MAEIIEMVWAGRLSLAEAFTRYGMSLPQFYAFARVLDIRGEAILARRARD